MARQLGLLASTALQMILVAANAAPPSSLFATRGSRPNIIFWLTDDWGYELWPSVNKQDEIATLPSGRAAYLQSAASLGVSNRYDELLPHTARHLVADGVSIRTLYTYHFCAPSRRSLMSGRFITALGEPSGGLLGLQHQTSTLANRLQTAGYATHFLGKVRRARRNGANGATDANTHYASAQAWARSPHAHTRIRTYVARGSS